MYYDNETVTYLNGKWQLATETQAGLYQQTFHYGNGVFEGIRSYATDEGTQILRAEAHYERLLYSAKTMHIDINHSVEELVEISYQLLAKNNLHNAYIRPYVFTDEMLGLQANSQANVFICAWDWGKYFDAGALKLKVSPYCRPNPRSCHVEAKVCGHYVNSILAMKDAHVDGFDDALLLDQNGFVAEASGANFFLQKDGALYTPPKGHILPGITRTIVMELCEANGIKVHEEFFKPEDIINAQGAFLTGTAVEVKAVGTVDKHEFTTPWEETFGALLKSQFEKLVRNQKVNAKKVRVA